MNNQQKQIQKPSVLLCAKMPVEFFRGMVMSLGLKWHTFYALARALTRNRRANVSMIFALTLIPITIAAGAGIDLGRAMIVRTRLAEALDSAGLAVGGTTGLTQ